MTTLRSTNTISSNLPSWLYELLPSIYIAIGLFAALKLATPIADLSALLLVAAGVQVLRMRHRYRKSQKYSRVKVRRAYGR